MKFDQIMEKVDIENSGLIYESLIFNIDDEQEITYEDGDKSWFLNGKLHRADGPAIERSGGDKYWFLNGKKYSEKEFNERVEK